MRSESTPSVISRSVQPRPSKHPARRPQRVVRRLPARVTRRQGIQEQRLVSAPSSPRAPQEQGRSWSGEAAATSRRINTASPLGR
mgnify:CR=1 FL=1